MLLIMKSGSEVTSIRIPLMDLKKFSLAKAAYSNVSIS